MNLRESAREAPHCFYCFLQNPNRDSLCLAHSNKLHDGRGYAHKSQDEKGAIICHRCHDLCDGRRGGLSKEAKREMHRIAHLRTVKWWLANGYIKELSMTNDAGLTLKDCPFCGSPAGWVSEGNHFVVGCGTCNGQVSRLDKADAISNWNRRALALKSREAVPEEMVMVPIDLVRELNMRVPSRPNAITYEHGIAILNFVQDRLLPAMLAAAPASAEGADGRGK